MTRLLMLFAVVCMGLGSGSASAVDSSKSFYKPVKQTVLGWTIWVDPLLLDGEGAAVGERALAALRHKLEMLVMVVPDVRVKQLRTVEIRLELHNDALGSMQYHPSKAWLVNNGHDPALARQVHIPRAKALYSKSQLHKHPWVVLHELSHAYHDQVLGFDHPGILAAYQAAVKAGSYEKVLLYNGETVRHYGLSNHKEYFAEGTEAYFGKNDFYPFVGAELKLHDPVFFALLETIWGKRP